MAGKRTTWDGEPVAPDPPYRASVVVYRWQRGRVEFLMLHGSHVEEGSGDWEWTPPSGARRPGEGIQNCARRELLEETGLSIDIREAEHAQDGEWHVYCAAATMDDHVLLDQEHDRYEWLSAEEALQRCHPKEARRALSIAIESSWM